MNFKLDTKEKFHVISINETEFPANMTDNLRDLFAEVTQNDVKHIILSLKAVQIIDPAAASFLLNEQHAAIKANRSFVICELQQPVKQMLKRLELLELLNTTPTESEAWDMVQMEDIERELLGGEVD